MRSPGKSEAKEKIQDDESTKTRTQKKILFQKYTIMMIIHFSPIQFMFINVPNQQPDGQL